MPKITPGCVISFRGSDFQEPPARPVQYVKLRLSLLLFLVESRKWDEPVRVGRAINGRLASGGSATGPLSGEHVMIL